MSIGLYGIYEKHTQEACPLYNEQNRKWILANLQDQAKNAQKYGVTVLQQYDSALEIHSYGLVRQKMHRL
jgi:hypothetical protein